LDARLTQLHQCATLEIVGFLCLVLEMAEVEKPSTPPRPESTAPARRPILASPPHGRAHPLHSCTCEPSRCSSGGAAPRRRADFAYPKQRPPRTGGRFRVPRPRPV